MRRGRRPTRHSGAAFQGHEINPSALHAGLELCAGVSFPYLLDDPGCRKVRVASGTGHGFQFSALDGFA
jgi:hypothetical protein